MAANLEQFTFLGYEVRVTDAIPDEHVMAQIQEWPFSRYVFFGRHARCSLMWANAITGRDVGQFLDVTEQSIKQRRSIAVM